MSVTKIVCRACGARNDLGRVFCSGCGQKLDFSRASMEGLARQAGRGFRVRRTIGALVALAVFAGAALAVWMPPAGEPASGGGSRVVSQKVQGLKIAVEGKRRASAAFSAQEVNAFLSDKAKELGLGAMSVDFRAGEVEADARRPFLAPLKLPRVGFLELGLAWNVTAVPAGAGLKAVRGRLGHLPLPGPAAGVALQRLRALMLRLLPDAATARAAVSGITVEAGRATVSVGG